MSPASAAITIANGNATLSTTNYNWINYGVASIGAALVPHEWVIYSDRGLGGAYSCVGTSFTNAYLDMGLALRVRCLLQRRLRFPQLRKR